MGIRKRGKSWAVSVYDPTTKEKRHVGTRPTRAEAEDLEYEARKKSRTFTARIDAGEFARTWVDRYPRTRESTNIGNRERITLFAAQFAGRPLDSISKMEARAWALAHRSRAPSVRAMFNDAMRDGLVESNPFANLRLKQRDGRKHLVVPTEEELGELAMQAAKVQGEWGALVLSPFIMFAAHTGLRPGELYALTWEDIDLRSRTVRVNKQWSAPEQKVTAPKYGSSRVPFLPDAAVDALERTARVRAEVFSAPRGGMLTGTVMGHYWRPVVNTVGRPDFTPHCLRHYYATVLASKGIGAPQIAKALGHIDGGKLALSRYIHVAEADARDQIAAAFGSNVRSLRAVPGASGEQTA